ncbi:MAG: ECF transporter S component [Faecousia sp.]
MKKTRFNAKTIALDAVMIALFVGLSFFSFIIAGVKVTMEDLPVVICAVVLGPIDAAIVGFLGEFLNQILTYGFTPTTLLWILPAVVRGLFAGFCMNALKKRFTTEEIFKTGRVVWIFVICAIAGMLASVCNTFAYYVDSTMYGYYKYELVFGVFWIRIVLGIFISSVMAAVSIPVRLALKSTRIIP